MPKRPSDDSRQTDIAQQLQPLVDDDAFLTELSLGNDPSKGEDPLAALLLELRDDVERQMPPAPVIEGADQEPAVISLDSARKRRRSNPLFAGLVGAAAATLVIAGGGAAIHGAGPSSPLYGANQALFGNDDPDMVELASTLDELENASNSGDKESMRKLLAEARKQLRTAEERGAANATPARVTETATTTVKPKPETTTVSPEQAAPVTVTDVQTQTVTETVPAGPVNPEETSAEPTGDPFPTENAGIPGNPDNPGEPGNPGNGANPDLPPPQVQQ